MTTSRTMGGVETGEFMVGCVRTAIFHPGGEVRMVGWAF